MSAISVVSERMPLDLHAKIETRDRRYRWAADDPDVRNVVGDIELSDAMPGGFDQASGVLARDPSVDYADLQELAKLRYEGVGGLCAWEGRLEASPRTSGDQMAITPGAVGYQAALDDDESVRWIYLDCAFDRWKGVPLTEKQGELSAGGYWGCDEPSVGSDYGGAPALVQSVSPAGGAVLNEGFYDGGGIPLGALYYGWERGSNVGAADASFVWTISLIDDIWWTNAQATGNLRATGPGMGSLVANRSTAKEIYLWFAYNAAAAGFAGLTCDLYWTYLAIVARDSAAIHGTQTPTGGLGVFASEVVQHAVNKWASELALMRGGISTIEASTFLIPQLAFFDFTTVSQIIKEATKFEFLDWWVDEGPTFNLAPPNNHGRRWRARVGSSKLEETGPQIDRVWNQVVVQYRDVSGVDRTVGPTGKLVDTVDDSLADADPQNPATLAGVTRCATVSMGTSTVDGAVKVGQTFIGQTKLRSTAGQATLNGYVQDADTGIWWPAWYVRSGDQISFSDAHDTRFRNIVKKNYPHSSRSATIDLDQPPEGLQELLERMQIALVGTGAS